MEYLEMHGSVKLKYDIDKAALYDVLGKLRELEFVDAGYINIDLSEDILRIDAEGTIFESCTTSALLKKLQGQLTASSVISVVNIRWETRVVLKHGSFTSDLWQQSFEQMALAQ